MNAGERLLALCGATGAAAALLQLLAPGSPNTGAALVTYSQRADITAAQHLLTDHVQNATGGGSWFSRPHPPDKKKRPDDEQALMLLGHL